MQLMGNARLDQHQRRNVRVNCFNFSYYRFLQRHNSGEILKKELNVEDSLEISIFGSSKHRKILFKRYMHVRML